MASEKKAAALRACTFSRPLVICTESDQLPAASSVLTQNRTDGLQKGGCSVAGSRGSRATAAAGSGAAAAAAAAGRHGPGAAGSTAGGTAGAAAGNGDR
jgi:hypothetical protein